MHQEIVSQGELWGWALGWHNFPESLKLHIFKTFPHPLFPKDYRKPKFSKIFGRLALPNKKDCALEANQNKNCLVNSSMTN